MARRKRHEEHQNHEAWAIPYADLLTLLLAFFVVMYAISSLNEGKYRVLSNSLSEAFGGSPRSIQPIQVGPVAPAEVSPEHVRPVPLGVRANPIRLSPSMRAANGPQLAERRPAYLPVSIPSNDRERFMYRGAQQQLRSIAARLQAALEDLVREDLVVMRREQLWLEVEIKSDILFPSGSAVLSLSALETIARLGAILAEVPNDVHVEGHTDDVPISTAQYPSNWELSAARAASVVHSLAVQGVAQDRMAVVGQGEFRPRESNATPEGRNANRRVVLVILAEPEGLSRDSPALHAGEVPVSTDSEAG
ncbi:flagellar motor protein MotD [Coralloluteibacterium thermophilus]|uniref:Flagellar motor protein MotD n=1 Tax=Coralloluteibacterium thermophilum TaxID=2707049 RepID=A0ABV9NG96_9GAMM